MRTGLAVGLGVLIGSSPFYGFHLAICLTVATILGLNRAITYLAAHVSLPWLAPFLIFASVQAGSLVLRGSFLPIDRSALTTLNPWTFGIDWLVGSAVVGTVLGLPAGVAAFGLTWLYRRRHPVAPDAVAERLARAAAAYRGLGRFNEGYVRGKLGMDPVFRQLVALAPLPSPVLDVGCGRGQTLVLLAQLQPGLDGLGLDWDAPKIDLARKAAAPGPGLRFEAADMRDADLAEAGTVLLLDVLHYNPVPQQDELLRRAARALRPGGVLLVRELDAARSVRAAINRWQERMGRLVRLNRGATLCFRPASELVAVLRVEGLDVSVVPSYGELPLANVLIEARKPAAQAAAAQG